MPISISLSELVDFAADCAMRSKTVADARNLPGPVRKSFSERPVNLSANAQESASIQEIAEFGTLDDYDGKRAWAAFLSFDMRKSSKRAVKFGAKSMYIAMHTYMSTLLTVVRHAEGTVVGLRGDGAIVMFNPLHMANSDTRVPEAGMKRCVREACACGTAIVEATVKAVNPALRRYDIPDIQVGVGIACGEFVATRIGIERAYDLTAYGQCVNDACHKSEYGSNGVYVTKSAKLLIPVTKGGTANFTEHLHDSNAYHLIYPPEHTAF